MNKHMRTLQHRGLCLKRPNNIEQTEKNHRSNTLSLHSQEVHIHLCMTLQVTLYTVLHCKRDTNLYTSVGWLKASSCDQVPFR